MCAYVYNIIRLMLTLFLLNRLQKESIDPSATDTEQKTSDSSYKYSENLEDVSVCKKSWTRNNNNNINNYNSSSGLSGNSFKMFSFTLFLNYCCLATTILNVSTVGVIYNVKGYQS